MEIEFRTEYSSVIQVSGLAIRAGVNTRTIRYYEELGILGL